jgi:G3E family GTPase
VHETYQALTLSEFAGHVKSKQTIPVTVITGFLGSGKTTLLNFILTKNHGKRIAVIENEYGEIGIDDLLIKDKFSGNEEIFLMNNGCICCTVRGDLIKTLGSLMEQSDKFDYILLETTGLADPAPIAQTFFTVPEIGSKLRMDGIITVCDAKHLLQHMDEKKPDGAVNESVEQVAFADRILLNKTDLVTKDELEYVHHRIRTINKVADIIPTQRSVLDIEKVLNIRAFDLDKITDVDPDFLLAKEEEEHDCADDCEEEHHHHHHDKKHKEKHGDEGKAEKDGMEHSDYVPKLGKGKHEHDSEVRSIGLTLKGDLEMDKLNAWMGKLLREQGASIYRMKGVLSVRGMESRFVFQGVHMIFDGNPGSPWRADELRQNKIVFIGKKLDRAALDQGLRACLAA